MLRAVRNEYGFSLIEVIIALSLLSIVGLAFLGGLFTASNAIIIADERATAESLARSQMEDIKNQGYTYAADYDGTPGSGEVIYLITVSTADYTICSTNREGITMDNVIYGVPWDSHLDVTVDNDVGLQRITLIIKHVDKPVITLTEYKVDR